MIPDEAFEDSLHILHILKTERDSCKIKEYDRTKPSTHYKYISSLQLLARINTASHKLVFLQPLPPSPPMSIMSSIFGRRGGRTSSVEPVSLDIWDPIDGFSFAIASPLSASPFASTKMDWKETPEAHVFIAEVPGLRKEDVKIEVEEEKILKISGERSRKTDEKNEKWHLVERTADKFVRTVRLPPNTNTDSVRANIEHGVLTVTVPKGQEKVHGARLIQISG